MLRLGAVHHTVCVVGDSAQCLPPGTLVSTPTGDVPIETVSVGDELLGRDDAGDAAIGRVIHVHTAPYDGPVLWVGGATSDYVTEEYVAAMDRWFPRNRRVTVKGAGHWVHSEQPDVFVQVLRQFLK